MASWMAARREYMEDELSGLTLGVFLFLLCLKATRRLDSCSDLFAVYSGRD